MARLQAYAFDLSLNSISQLAIVEPPRPLTTGRHVCRRLHYRGQVGGGVFLIHKGTYGGRTALLRSYYTV